MTTRDVLVAPVPAMVLQEHSGEATGRPMGVFQVGQYAPITLIVALHTNHDHPAGTGQHLYPRTLAAVRTVLEAAGVELIQENGGGPGVRLRKK